MPAQIHPILGTTTSLTAITVVKTFFVSTLSICMAYLWPIKDHVTVLVVLAGIDFVMGIAESWIVKNENFNLRKAFRALGYLVIYFAAIALTWIIGKLQGDMEESKMIVKSLSYGVVYIYGKNIFRNAKSLWPNNEAIHYLCYFFNMEFIKRLPDMAAYKRKKSTKQS